MSFVLKLNNDELAKTKYWSPVHFGDLTKTSFPREVTQNFVWEHDGYWLGWVPDQEPEPLTQEQIIQQYINECTQLVQQHLDETAQAKGYDNIVSACSYAGAPNPFQSESISFISWRGAVWAYCYAELEKLKSGEREISSIKSIINELPIFLA